MTKVQTLTARQRQQNIKRYARKDARTQALCAVYGHVKSNYGDLDAEGSRDPKTALDQKDAFEALKRHQRSAQWPLSVLSKHVEAIDQRGKLNFSVSEIAA